MTARMTARMSALTTAVAQRDRVSGEWTEPEEQLPGTVDDPNTGEPRQRQQSSSVETVERALAAAAACHADGAWAWAPAEVRVRLLERVAEGLAARVPDIGLEDALSTGNPLRVATTTASYLAPRVLSARDQLLQVGEERLLPAGGRTVRLLHRPVGPAVVLAPWNAPTFVSVAKVASALAAGCPVILKPSEWAPGGCQLLAEVVVNAVDELGLPADVFQLVHGAGAVGSRLAGDGRVRAISFTGGQPAGRAVALAAAPHFTSLQLELGSHNPAVVLPDADIAATAAALAEGMTTLNGQWCEAPGKVLVPDALHDDLLEALVEELSDQTVGHCLEAGTDVGPLAYSLHRERLRQQVSDLVDAGGRAHAPAALPDLGGWFFAPTVVSGLDQARSQDELFGPVVTLHRVASVDEALEATDSPATGLAGFVFGTDLPAALDVAARIPAGEVRVNGCKLADLADGSEQSFWNRSGIGGHGPTDMVRFFQGRRTVGVDDPDLPI